MAGEINEVEAYVGENDPASHAARGQTPRNQMMYGLGGHAYIYFTYGMYHCLNVVTEQEDFPAAILIRSVIPVEGSGIMLHNRMQGRRTPVHTKDLSNGPGKLCQAFGLTKTQNGTDLVTSDIFYIEDRKKKITTFQTSPRIGVSQGRETLWRFFY